MDGTGPKNNGNSGSNGDGDRCVRQGAARWNALKHGVLSQRAVLPTEDPSQFQELLKNLREDREPEGALEDLLVEKIAVCFWRLRRILLYDFGNNQQDIPGLLAEEARLKKLTELRRELVENELTDDLRKRLPEFFTAPTVDWSTVSGDQLCQCLDECIALQQGSVQKVKSRKEALNLSTAVTKKSLDTLLRYETSNERQLYRAIDQLERLQRQRAGDYVPPPVKVGVSTDV